MQSKRDILNENSLLNEELFKESPKANDTTYHIMSFLSPKALSSLVHNKNCYYALQPQRIEEAFVRHVFKDNKRTVNEMLNKHPEFTIHQLLGYIALGNQDEAEKMLNKQPELLLQSGSVIDPSGRFFKKIKPFELLLWTMDVRYMANMVIDSVRKAKNGEEIRVELLKQYKAVIENFDAQKKTGGVHYTLNGKKHHEKHFDFQPLINALDIFVKNYVDRHPNECKRHWCQVVGKEQSMLPMHVRQHYCDPDVSFGPTPSFDKKELKRNLKFYHYVNNDEVVWNSKLIGLGVDFGIMRACFWKRPEGRGGWPGGAERLGAKLDLAAMRGLCNKRTVDLKLLKEQLLQPIENRKRPRTLLV